MVHVVVVEAVVVWVVVLSVVVAVVVWAVVVFVVVVVAVVVWALLVLVVVVGCSVHGHGSLYTCFKVFVDPRWFRRLRTTNISSCQPANML